MPKTSKQERARAIIVYKNSLILMKRKWKGGEYCVFPGGGVEKGETREQALIRECYEELGVKVSAGKVFAEQNFRGDHEIFYHAKYVSGKIGSGTGEEFSRSVDHNGSHEVVVVPKKKLETIVLKPGHIADQVFEKVFGLVNKPSGILKQLKGKDRRSTGNADAIAKRMVKKPALFDEVFEGLSSEDAIMRMRAADALEKASAQNTALLSRHKDRILKFLEKETQQEVQWHLCQMVPRVWWTKPQVKKAANIFQKWIHDPKITSGIVKTFSLQALFDLADQEPGLLPAVQKEIAYCSQGTFAMKSRAKKLKLQLQKKKK